MDDDLCEPSRHKGVVDLGNRKSGGAFQFVATDDIKLLAEGRMPDEMRSALDQRKGRSLLAKLQWLSEIMVLQQSVAYGDYTASIVESVLYDPANRSLRKKPEDGPSAQLVALALAAMRANPVLAHNVITLGMRHSIADSVGGLEAVEAVRFNQTNYTFARSDFRKGTCGVSGPKNTLAKRRLREMLPNWKFELRVTAAEKSRDEFKFCEEEVVQ